MFIKETKNEKRDKNISTPKKERFNTFYENCTSKLYWGSKKFFCFLNKYIIYFHKKNGAKRTFMLRFLPKKVLTISQGI